jgi:hypothetical protein
MNNQGRNWEPPKVFILGAIPEGLGHCVGGTTAQTMNCGAGQITAGDRHTCHSGGAAKPTGEYCVSGSSGFDNGCVTGTQKG